MTTKVEPMSETELAKFSREPYTPEDGFVGVMWGDWQQLLAIARDHARLHAENARLLSDCDFLHLRRGQLVIERDQLRIEVERLRAALTKHGIVAVSRR